MKFLKIKTYLNIYFKLTLSLSIILSSSYGYSQEDFPEDTNLNLRSLIAFFKSSGEDHDNLLENLSSEERESLINIRQRFKELSSAVDNEVVEEYLRSHRDVVSELDYHQLIDQEARVVDSNRVIDFNVENTYTYPILTVGVDVDFNGNGQMILEGLLVQGGKNGTKRKVGIEYTFERVLKEDIISFTQDGEFLILLHRERGLVVYDMRLVLNRLGEMPMPSTVLDGNILHDQKITNEEVEKVKVQFIPAYKSYKYDIGVSPEADSVARDKNGNPVLVSGDLIVTVDGVLKKNYSREGLKKRLSNMYDRIATRVILQELLPNTKDLSLEDVSIVDLSSVILRMMVPSASVSYFKPFIDEFLYLSRIPVESNNHDVFQVINRGTSPKGSEEVDTVWKKIRNLIVKHQELEVNTIVIAGALAAMLTYFNGEGGIGLPYGVMANDHVIILGLGLLLAGYVAVRSSIPLFKGIAALNNWALIERSLKDLISTLNKMVKDESLELQVRNQLEEHKASLELFYKERNNDKYAHEGDLSSVLVSLRDFLRNEDQQVPRSVRVLLSSNKLEISLHQIIEKWDGKSTGIKTAGSGFRIYSPLLVPFYKRVFQLFGHSNFFRALEKDVKPWAKVSPESELGRKLGVNNSMRVGLNIPIPIIDRIIPSQQRRHDKQVRAINKLHLKKKQVESLSRLISIRALINKPLASQSDFRIPEGELLDELKDENFQLRFEWVSRQLMKHIEKKDGSVAWTQETMQSYYEKALELSQQSLTLESSVLADLKERLMQNMRSLWNKVVHWNAEESEILRSILPKEQVAKTFVTHLLVDHFTITTIPFAYGVTPRGDLSIASIESMGLVPGGFGRFLFGFSSDAHFVEVFMNIVQHTVISGRGQLMNIHALLENYPPINNSGEYMSTTGVENRQSWVNYLGQLGRFAVASGGETRPDIPENSLIVNENRIDFGYQFYRFVVKYYQFIQAPFILFMASRTLITDSSFLNSISGSMFFVFGGLMVYGFPQILQILYNNQYLGRKLSANQNGLILITQDISQLRREAITSEAAERNMLDAVVKQIVQMYFQNRNIIALLKYLGNVEGNVEENDALKRIFLREINTQKDSFNSFSGRASRIFDSIESSVGGYEDSVQDQEYKALLSQLKTEKLETELLRNKHIPTEMSNIGNSVVALLALGIFSNVAFVYLSRDSYTYNTMDNIFTLLGLTFGVALAGETAFRYSLKEWKQKFKDLSLSKKMSLLLTVTAIASPFYAPYDITDFNLLDSMILSYVLWVSNKSISKIRHIFSIKKPNGDGERVLDRSRRMIQRMRGKCSEMFTTKKDNSD